MILPRLRQYSSGGLVFGSKGDLAWSAAWGDTDGWHMSGTVQHNQYTGHSVMDVLHIYFETRSSQAQTPTSGVGKPCIASQRPGTPVAKQQFFNSVSPSKCRETPGIVSTHTNRSKREVDSCKLAERRTSGKGCCTTARLSFRAQVLRNNALISPTTFMLRIKPRARAHRKIFWKPPLWKENFAEAPDPSPTAVGRSCAGMVQRSSAWGSEAWAEIWASG